MNNNEKESNRRSEYLSCLEGMPEVALRNNVDHIPPHTYSVNVIATTSICVYKYEEGVGFVKKPFDLKKYALLHPFWKTSLNKLASATARIKGANATARLFGSSGRIVLSGCPAPPAAVNAIKTIVWILQNDGINCSYTRPVIENVVTKAETGFLVNLTELSQSYVNSRQMSGLNRRSTRSSMIEMHFKEVNYEAGSFPGCTVKLREPETTCIVFRSGQVIITGAKEPSEAKKTWAIMRQILVAFKDVNDNVSNSSKNYRKSQLQEETFIRQMVDTESEEMMKRIGERLKVIKKKKRKKKRERIMKPSWLEAIQEKGSVDYQPICLHVPY